MKKVLPMLRFGTGLGGCDAILLFPCSHEGKGEGGGRRAKRGIRQEDEQEWGWSRRDSAVSLLSQGNDQLLFDEDIGKGSLDTNDKAPQRYSVSKATTTTAGHSHLDTTKFILLKASNCPYSSQIVVELDTQQLVQHSTRKNCDNVQMPCSMKIRFLIIPLYSIQGVADLFIPSHYVDPLRTCIRCLSTIPIMSFMDKDHLWNNPLVISENPTRLSFDKGLTCDSDE
ncbi:hypothetical protein Tco_0326735 [Tanacetum coccineum]